MKSGLELDIVELSCPLTTRWRQEVIHIILVFLTITAITQGIGWVLGLWWIQEWIPAIVTVVGITYLVREGTRRRRVPTEGKAVLVTGCDTGFGNALVRRLDVIPGLLVFAGCLHKTGPYAQELKSACSDRVHLIQLDVTRDEQVTQAKVTVQKLLEKQNIKGLWGVLNNAGSNHLGDVEITSMEDFRTFPAINQFGLVSVTKAFLPLVRQCKGRIVNITSVKGLIPIPLTAAYSMAKAATEMFSDILRMEMKKFGVKVVTVEPCNFSGSTAALCESKLERDMDKFWSGMDSKLRAVYGREYVDSHKTVARNAIPTGSRKLYLILDVMLDAMFSVQPNSRYLVAGGSGWVDTIKWRALAYPYVPTWLMDKILLDDITASFPLPASLKTT